MGSTTPFRSTPAAVVKLLLLSAALLFFFFITLSSSPLISDLPPVIDHDDNASGVESSLIHTSRSVLALKSDPLRPRLDQIRRQADDHKSLVLAYASYARKLKLENSKLVQQ